MQDDNPLVIDTSYELSDRNQSLIIKMVKLEHEGKYNCLVRNELGEDKAEGLVTIKGKNDDLTVNTVSLFSKYHGHLLIVLRSMIGTMYKHPH
jgi:hypothetical protein